MILSNLRKAGCGFISAGSMNDKNIINGSASTLAMQNPRPWIASMLSRLTLLALVDTAIVTPSPCTFDFYLHGDMASFPV